MRIKPIAVACSLMAIACSSPQDEVVEAPSVVADGAYSLTHSTWTYADTVVEYEPQQIKIYSGGRYMFATWNSTTNAPAIGAGAAWSEHGMLYEQPYYGASGATDSSQTFELNIATTEAGFDQSINGISADDSTSFDLNESWNGLSGEPTQFDGLWLLTSRSEIDGVANFQEVKMIGGGHFVWYHTWSDSIDHADFGYGQFIDNGDGSVTEVAQVGSIDGYEGEWSINYTLIGSDMLQQSYINNIDSSEVIQNFKRL